MILHNVFATVLISLLPVCTAGNITTTSKTSNLAPLQNQGLTHCNASTSWLPDDTSFDDIYPDCVGATLLFLREADKHRGERFAFHAFGVTPSYGLNERITPLRYIYSEQQLLRVFLSP